MKRYVLIILAILGAYIPTALAQDSIPENTFSMDMQLRPRAEMRDGNFRPLSKEENPAVLVNNRLRLNLKYSYEHKLITKISLQSINIWGQANQVQKLNETNNQFGVFEAWADLQIYKNFRTRVGRQVIMLDDERLFSDINWGASARTHDALSLYYKTPNLSIDSYFAFNQNYTELYGGNLNNPSGNLYSPKNAQPYKHLEVLHLAYQPTTVSQFSFIFANVGYQNVDPEELNPDKTLTNLQTIGANYNWTKDNSQIKLSGFYQFGKDLLTRDVSAYLLSAGYDYRFSPQLNIGIRSDYLSGNKPGSTSKNKSFNTLFGSGHKFYGHMDYYPYGNFGLWNNVIEGRYSFSQKSWLNGSAHFFLSPEKLEINNQEYSQNLGQEIDLDFHYKPFDFAQISIGYSIYFTNDNITALKGVENPQSIQNWAWVSLDITPELFKIQTHNVHH